MRKSKRADKVDAHIGRRIQFRRIMLGETQRGLGEKLGVSFQQVQRYELGANQVSASRLLALANLLDVPVTYFFETHLGEGSLLSPQIGAEDLSMLVTSKQSYQLLNAFNRVKDRRVRTELVQLACALAALSD